MRSFLARHTVIARHGGVKALLQLSLAENTVVAQVAAAGLMGFIRSDHFLKGLSTELQQARDVCMNLMGQSRSQIEI